MEGMKLKTELEAAIFGESLARGVKEAAIGAERAAGEAQAAVGELREVTKKREREAELELKERREKEILKNEWRRKWCGGLRRRGWLNGFET